MKVFDDFLNNPQYWKKHWSNIVYNRAKSIYDYIRYFNPNWVILNDAATHDPWNRLKQLSNSSDASVQPFTTEELLNQGYLKILYIGHPDEISATVPSTYLILANKLYWREGILNSFLKKVYVWGGDETAWIKYGGEIDSQGNWWMTQLLLEQLNFYNTHPLVLDNLEFYNPSLEIAAPTGIDDTMASSIPLADAYLYKSPDTNLQIGEEIEEDNWSIFYGLSNCLQVDLTGRPLLQLPTNYVVFNNYQPVFTDFQGKIRNIPSFENHMLIIPMSSSLVYSITAIYEDNEVKFVGIPVETNGNINQIVFSYNPCPTRFTYSDDMPTKFDIKQTYQNRAVINTQEYKIYDFTNNAYWNGESFLTHETYFDKNFIDEMILDETFDFSFINIDNSVSHGYTINVKNTPSNSTHYRVLY